MDTSEEREWKLVKKAFRPLSFLDIRPKIYYKRVKNCILELHSIPETKINDKRRGMKNRLFAKFRGSHFWCHRIFDITNRKFLGELEHDYINPWDLTTHPIVYQAKKLVAADHYEIDSNIICGGGIHVFMTLEAAFCYQPHFGCVFYMQHGQMMAVGPQGDVVASNECRPDHVISIHVMC
jgi:hypothetical protein